MSKIKSKIVAKFSKWELTRELGILNPHLPWTHMYDSFTKEELLDTYCKYVGL